MSVINVIMKMNRVFIRLQHTHRITKTELVRAREPNEKMRALLRGLKKPISY